MSDPRPETDPPLPPDAARAVARVRLMMVVSMATTLVAVIAVVTVIGYRLLRSEGSAPAADATGLLPKGARIVATAVAEDRIVVTLEIGGATEIRTFDLRTLRQTGRLRFATEP